MPSQVETDPARIKTIVQEAEYKDWSFEQTAAVLGHSRDCTFMLCMAVNGGPEMKCSCGAGAIVKA